MLITREQPVRTSGMKRTRYESAGPRLLSLALLWWAWVGLQGSVDGAIAQGKGINTELNLSSNNVHSFMRDQQGRLWIGTSYGLDSWDGFEVKRYNSDDSDLRITDRVIHLFEWDDKLLVSGYFKGLLYLDLKTKQIQRLPVGDDAFSGYAYDVCALDEDRILFTSGPSGVYSWNRNSGESRPILTDQGVVHGKCIEKDAKGQIWMGSWEKGLFRYNAEKDLFETVLLPPAIRGMEQKRINDLGFDENGTLAVLIWAYGLLLIHETQENEILSYELIAGNELTMKNRHLSALAVDGNRRIWLGSGTGLDYIERDDSGKYRPGRFSDADLPLKLPVISLYSDEEQNLWIGTKGGGLIQMHLHNDQFHSFEQLRAATHGSEIVGLFELTDDRLLVSSANKGVFVVNRTSGEHSRPKDDPVTSAQNQEFSFAHHTSVLHPYHRNDSTFLAIGSLYTGFQLVPFGRNASGKNQPLIYSETWFYSSNDIETDRFGRIWVAHGFGTSVFEPITDAVDFDKEFLENFRVIENKTAPMLASKSNCLYNDSGQAMLIGSNKYGLLSIPIAETLHYSIEALTRYEIRDGSGRLKKDYPVSCIYRDSRNTLWVGTIGEGLHQLIAGDNVLRTPEQAMVLRTAGIQSIVADQQGRLWIGTNKGLYAANPDNLMEVERFSIVDGLPSNNFSTGVSYCDSDGLVWMGTAVGLIRFDPTAVRNNHFQPKMGIERIALFGRDAPNEIRFMDYYQLPEKNGIKILEVRYPFQSVELMYASLSYKDPELNQYRYRIVGFQDQWKYSELGNRIASFSNLKEGDYLFEIEGSNNGGRWCQEPLRMIIRFHPAYWQQRWFRWSIGTALFFWLFLVVFLRLRQVRIVNRKLEQRVRERTEDLRVQNEKLESIVRFKNRFLSILAHDLKNPLCSLISYADLMNTDFDQSTIQEQRRFAKRTFESSTRLFQLLNRLLELGKTGFEGGSQRCEALDLSSIILNGTQLYSENSKQILIRTEMGHPVPPIFGDQSLVEFVIRNLVGNAIKFSECGSEIVIKGAQEGRFYRVEVIDQGIGIEANEIKNLFDPEKIHLQSGTKGEAGSGLGLVTCKEFVERMGGSLKVESEKGKGSSFSFLLPLAAKDLPG